MAILPYTTDADVQAYCTDLVSLPADAVARERLINRAVRDVDSVLALRTRDTVNGLRVTPATDLAAWEQAALSRAVGAQVAYRVQMGEQFFVEDQYSAVTGPEFSVRGRRSRLAPAALDELAAIALRASQSFSLPTTPLTWQP